MKKYIILHLEKDMDLSELKFILFANNYKSKEAFYYNKPIFIDKIRKTFENIEKSKLEDFKIALNRENKSFLEFTFSEYQNYLKSKDKSLER